MTAKNIWVLEVDTEITSNISPLIAIVNKHCQSREQDDTIPYKMALPQTYL